MKTKKSKSATASQRGVKLIDSLIQPKSRVGEVLLQEEVQGLLEIRTLLVSLEIEENAVPREIVESDENDVNRYLAEEFGGIRRGMSLKTAAKSVLNGLRFIQAAKSLSAASAQPAAASSDHKLYLPPEWQRLSMSRRNYLNRLLSYDNLSRWDYDALELSEACGGAPLLFLTWAILAAPHAQKAMARSLGLEPPGGEAYEFLEEYHIDPVALCNFLRVVENDYPAGNAYHNGAHAADVVQTTFALLRMGGDAYASSSLEIFSLLCAAACHDMGHPGRNNSYQVSSRSDLAVIYNDTAVLENMHAARAFRVMLAAPAHANLDLLSGLRPAQKNAFRANFTKAILATDMSQHFSTLASLKAKIAAFGPDDPSKFYHNETGRPFSTVLLFLLHVADISNPAKPAPIFTEWCDRCLDEFFAQGDAEKQEGLPVSPMCDRHLTKKSDSQIGFIKFIVRPSFVLISDLIPLVVDDILPILETNLRYWESEKLKEVRLSKG